MFVLLEALTHRTSDSIAPQPVAPRFKTESDVCVPPHEKVLLGRWELGRLWKFNLFPYKLPYVYKQKILSTICKLGPFHQEVRICYKILKYFPMCLLLFISVRSAVKQVEIRREILDEKFSVQQSIQGLQILISNVTLQSIYNVAN